jgi:Ion channel
MLPVWIGRQGVGRERIAGERNARESVTNPGATSRRRERYGVLLGAIVIAFTIQGVAEPGKWQQIVTSVLLGVTLLLAFFAADMRPRFLRPAALIVSGLVILSIVEAINGNIDSGATRVTNALLVLLAPPAIVLGVVRSLRTRQAVTLEAVFGVLCVYILLGMFFAFVYGSINQLGGAPFFAGEQSATVAHCLYFSFTTLTTVGFGDLTARTNLGHTLSASEALMGQIYLVTVVSLIVANLGRGGPATRSREVAAPPSPRRSE